MTTKACRHVADEEVCGDVEGVRMFITGERCPRHTPAALAGRPETIPDPELTLDALMRKASRSYVYSRADSALIDERAISSGRRRARSAEYRQAQKAEHSRRMGEKARRRARGGSLTAEQIPEHHMSD